MNSNVGTKTGAAHAELSDAMLDEVVGGGSAATLIGEGNALIQEGVASAIGAGATFVQAAATYASAGVALIEDRVSRTVALRVGIIQNILHH